jgi:cbb3-type cytochrome oxidase cytochrome c subunit
VAFLDGKMYRDTADGAYEIAPALSPHNTTGPYEKYQFDPDEENPPPFKLHVDESLSIEQLLQNTKMSPVLVDPAVEQQMEAAKEAAAKAAEKAAEVKAQKEAEAAKKAAEEAAKK